MVQCFSFNILKPRGSLPFTNISFLYSCCDVNIPRISAEISQSIGSMCTHCTFTVIEFGRCTYVNCIIPRCRSRASLQLFRKVCVSGRTAENFRSIRTVIIILQLISVVRGGGNFHSVYRRYSLLVYLCKLHHPPPSQRSFLKLF